MPTWTLVLAAALGTAHVAARLRARPRLAAVLKPLPIAVLAAALLAVDATDGRYRAFVVLALVASMAGDVLLVIPTRFVAGLACFLTAHVLYIAAFAPAARPGAAAWLALVPFVVFAGLVLRRLAPHLGRQRAPVTAYVAVIAMMGWVAAARALAGVAPPPSGVLAAVGAAFFMASDTTLAFDRFVRPLPHRDVAVMGTYYLAQLLLASSAAV